MKNTPWLQWGSNLLGIAKVVNCIAQNKSTTKPGGRVRIVYYQDVPQLPGRLNTLSTIHLNAKSRNLLYKSSLSTKHSCLVGMRVGCFGLLK